MRGLHSCNLMSLDCVCIWVSPFVSIYIYIPLTIFRICYIFYFLCDNARYRNVKWYKKSFLWGFSAHEKYAMDLQEKQVIEQARAVLVTKMDSDTVIHHPRLKTVLSKAKEDELLQIASGLKRAHCWLVLLSPISNNSDWHL